MNLDIDLLEQTLVHARDVLLGQRTDDDHWVGRLSSSALSTATAVCALHLCRKSAGGDDSFDRLVDNGRRWLAEHQNADGGWGDTTLSISNISTTALCWAAFSGADHRYPETIRAAEQWLARQAGDLHPPVLAEAIKRRYGKDRTFSVPILTALALSGRLGEGRHAWQVVPQLPFELAALPHRWYARLRLPVVSYALPALIAIGQVRHHHRPTLMLPFRLLRALSRRRTLSVLESIQPSSGGFLEATPLTSFVVMSLIGAGEMNHPVVQHGIEFLARSVRDDGSWPIDTNLATWVTTLSVNALNCGANVVETLGASAASHVRRWLLDQQYRVEHPYTNSPPGGWAWTNLPGGVPDADDTPSALLALKVLDDGSGEVRQAAAAGTKWLLDLQNSDGGIPTFCRGWGTLPFDRSSADLTAHVIRAWLAWRSDLPADLRQRVDRSIEHAMAFLVEGQRADGSWLPLWFGNQHANDDENPTYGTTRVVLALVAVLQSAEVRTSVPPGLQRAVQWMLDSQNADGGWGGAAGTKSSIEETALAVEALAAVVSLFVAEELSSSSMVPPAQHASDALSRGIHWLAERTHSGRDFPPTPIGFYFAKLWYYEEMYPLIYTVAALGRAIAVARGPIPQVGRTEVNS